MSKLFNIPAKKRNVTFYLQSYKGNRVLSKIITQLKDSKIFSVCSVSGTSVSRIFEISIFTDKDLADISNLLKEEFIEIMNNKTPDNYLFSFKSGAQGFVNSFNVYSSSGFHFEVCHKIKEVKKNTSIPDNKIIL